MDEVSSHVGLDLPLVRRQGRLTDCSASSRIPWWNGLGADSGEKREPVGDIDIAVVDSLKVLDPRRPIREADIAATDTLCRFSLTERCLVTAASDARPQSH